MRLVDRLKAHPGVGLRSKPHGPPVTMAATVHRAKYTTAIQPTTCEWTSRSIAATTLGKTKSLSGTVCDNAVCNNDVVRVEFFRFIGTKNVGLIVIGSGMV